MTRFAGTAGYSAGRAVDAISQQPGTRPAKRFFRGFLTFLGSRPDFSRRPVVKLILLVPLVLLLLVLVLVIWLLRRMADIYRRAIKLHEHSLAEGEAVAAWYKRAHDQEEQRRAKRRRRWHALLPATLPRRSRA
jgi:hypothetical protein